MLTFRIFCPSRRPSLEKISPTRPARFSVADNISMHRSDSGTASGLSSPFFPLRRGPGIVHTLALKSISDQSASNVSLVLVAVRISHSSGSEPIPGHRIRHYGLLASATCKANIAHAKELIAVPPPEIDPSTEPDDAAITVGAAADHRPPCPCCGGRMIIAERFGPGGQPRDPPSPQAGVKAAAQ